MDPSILLGYAGGIITMAGLAMYPENFKPTVMEKPQAYLVTGILLAGVSVALDLWGGWF